MYSNIEQIKSNIRKLYTSNVSEDILAILFELASEINDVQQEIKQISKSIDRLEYMSGRSNK